MTKPIRILHVLGRLDIGGAETMIMNIYRNINRSEIQFDFIKHTEDECEFDKEILTLGGRIYTIPRFNGKNYFIYRKAWNNFFIDHPEYKIIHGHMRSTASIYLKEAKKFGLRTIAHSHSTSSGWGISALTKNILQYPIRYIADYLFACSNSAGEWLYGKKASKNDNFFIINNAIDTLKFSFNEDMRLLKRKEFNIENKFVIGHVGRFHFQKNHEFLIDVFKIIHDKDEKAVLLLIGEGSLRPAIEKKVIDYSLVDSVIFTGARSDIHELMQMMDVFVFPSLNEGLGIVAVEAQTAGLPTIVAESVPEEAFLTDLIKAISLKKSANYWATQIIKYDKNTKRDDMSSKIKKQGYDIKEVAKQMESFYVYNC